MTPRPLPTADIAAAGDALQAALVPTLLESELSDKLSAARRRCDLLELENARLRDSLKQQTERVQRLMQRGGGL